MILDESNISPVKSFKHSFLMNLFNDLDCVFEILKLFGLAFNFSINSKKDLFSAICLSANFFDQYTTTFSTISCFLPSSKVTSLL